MFWQSLFTQFEQYIIPYGIRLLSAIIILLIGFWVAYLIRKVVNHALLKRRVEHTVRIFVSHITYATLLAFVAIAVLAHIGVQTTSLVAVLGASFFAIMLSLKNSLSSLASGILLVIFRPFRVGDYIVIDNIAGTVNEVQLMFTQLTTGDNKVIFIPNDKLTADAITNYSRLNTRRLDLTFTVDYTADLIQVRKLGEEVMNQDRRILFTPEKPIIAVTELAPNGVKMIARYWCAQTDYWQLQLDLPEALKLCFDREGINLSLSSTIVLKK